MSAGFGQGMSPREAEERARELADGAYRARLLACAEEMGRQLGDQERITVSADMWRQIQQLVRQVAERLPG
jgi:phosphosulfolactate synthase (CoM biosynthesis protein A)